MPAGQGQKDDPGGSSEQPGSPPSLREVWICFKGIRKKYYIDEDALLMTRDEL